GADVRKRGGPRQGPGEGSAPRRGSYGPPFGTAGTGFSTAGGGNNDENTIGWTLSPASRRRGVARRRGAEAMNLAWRQQARCRGVDPATFYPVSDEDEALDAKEICATCPVREPCLEYALTVREKHGVWGGRTERERRRLIRQRRKSA